LNRRLHDGKIIPKPANCQSNDCTIPPRDDSVKASAQRRPTRGTPTFAKATDRQAYGREKRRHSRRTPRRQAFVESQAEQVQLDNSEPMYADCYEYKRLSPDESGSPHRGQMKKAE
jgi:hypothetical protein